MMKPLPAFFDLDSDNARREAFGRDLDRIDAQHAAQRQRPAAPEARPRPARPAKPLSLKAAR